MDCRNSVYLNLGYAQFNRVSRVNLSTIKYGSRHLHGVDLVAINMDALKITVASPRDLIGLAFLSFFFSPLHVALDHIVRHFETKD